MKSEYLLLSINLSSCPLRFLSKGNDLTVVMLFINNWEKSVKLSLLSGYRNQSAKGKNYFSQVSVVDGSIRDFSRCQCNKQYHGRVLLDSAHSNGQNGGIRRI